MIDNERYTIHIQEQQVTIKNQSTNETKKTTVNGFIHLNKRLKTLSLSKYFFIINS